jgi:hypothetical protein
MLLCKGRGETGNEDGLAGRGRGDHGDAGRLGDLSEHDRNRACQLMKLCQRRIAGYNDCVRRGLHQVRRHNLCVGSIAATPVLPENQIRA